MHGHAEIGIEWDDAACATAREAGHERIQADVAALDPMDFAPCWGLIGGPPCPTFSSAGKGAGHRDMEHIVACLHELAAGQDNRAAHLAACEDERSLLVVEPLRWALALRPTWIALEQVPPVLGLWTLYAQILETFGWNVWTGVLEAERYGVPQTRERAIFMAHRDRPVQPPPPTHQRYVPGEPQRHDVTMFGEVLPWVSMAEALGWDEGWRLEPDRGAGMIERHGDRPDRLASEPGPTVTGHNRRWKLRAGTNANDIARPADEPAPTLRLGGRSNAVDWVNQRPAPTIVGTRRSKDGMLVGRQLPEGEGENIGGWGYERPSTTVCADPRIPEPGWRGNPEDYADGKPTRSGDRAVRVTIQEAAVLQSFRPDYPWRGTKSKQFQQVGNAVPPLLAYAVLGQLLEPVEVARAA